MGSSATRIRQQHPVSHNPVPTQQQPTQAMSGSSGSSGKGFTEEDQEALFDAVTASALSKGSRVGLGFGGGGGSTSPPPPAKAEGPKPQQERGKEDGEQGRGERSKGEREERKRKRRSRSRSGDRDRRHRHSSKRRSRSASRGKSSSSRRRGSSRSRSRSRSRGRERSRRERSQERGNGRGKSRRSGSRQREHKRRARSSSRSRDESRRKAKEEGGKGPEESSMSQQAKAQSAILSIGERIRQRVASAIGVSGNNGGGGQEPARPREPAAGGDDDAMTALERLKAKARASLQAAEAGDADLARTTRAGQGWERGDMSRTSEFLKEEEAHATGGEARLAEQARRQRMIAAIEDEGVEMLSESLPCREQRAAEQKAAEAAAQRAREEERAARRARRREEASLPLFKRLRAGDRVEAKWSMDGVWYAGVVKATMHGGYPNMRAEVLFSGYGNVDEVSWRDIKLVAAAPASDGEEEEEEDEGSVRSSPSVHRGRPVDSRSPSPAAAERGERGQGNGGAGRAAGEEGREEEEEEEEEEEDTGLLNPALARRLAGNLSSVGPMSATPAAAPAPAPAAGGDHPAQPPQLPPAKPLSWKEKALAAQRALREKRLQQQNGGGGEPSSSSSSLTVQERASQLAKAVEETRVSQFLQDASRPKLSLALKKPAAPSSSSSAAAAAVRKG